MMSAFHQISLNSMRRFSRTQRCIAFCCFPASALIERMKKRDGPWDHILIDKVPMVYSYLEPMPKDGWIVLDSGESTIEQTVHEVLSHIGAVSDNT